MLAIAVLAGSRSFPAIGEWATDLPDEHLVRVGLNTAPDDVTFDEDRSQVLTGQAPRVMAAQRNTSIKLLRLAAIPFN